MSDFRKYDHVERWGHDDVEGIEIGTVHVFPKLDGTNASVWYDSSLIAPPESPGVQVRLCAASRLRKLGHVDGVYRDNHGFYEWMKSEEIATRLCEVFSRFPDWILYGEWLVPHTLKTYREEAWRRFWIFDVWARDQERYMPVEDYLDILQGAGLDVIEPLCTFLNPSEKQLRREVDANTYLIRDGAGVGEGVVVKNFEWRNRSGCQPWAKFVRNEFKEENKRAFGTTEKGGEFQVEAAIAEEFVTAALVDKERAKVRLAVMNERGAAGTTLGSVEVTYRGEVLPRLLQTVYHALVTEELWAALKRHKDPTVDFRKLRRHVTHWTKRHAADLFS